MKKFSKYTNSPVGEEPKKEVKINEEELLKVRVLKLMDDFLRVQTYGPISQYHVAGTMKVAGKELFVEALMDLLSNKKSFNEIKILEDLKHIIHDHESIDNKIDEINSRKKNIHIQKSKVKSLYERYKHDEEILFEMVKSSVEKISKEERILRLEACDSLGDDIDFSILERLKTIYRQD